jgi:PadR family transcriptional regulator, regulatory protein PadR
LRRFRFRSAWKVTEGGRDAKTYTLTRAGRAQLQKELEQWERMSNAAGLIVRMAPESSV